MIYVMSEGKTILSEKTQEIDPVLQYATLLVVVPRHGTAKYTWEKENSSTWKNLRVPTDACVIYVRSSGMYRCQVTGQVYHFEVCGMYIKFVYLNVIIMLYCSESHTGSNGMNTSTLASLYTNVPACNARLFVFPAAHNISSNDLQFGKVVGRGSFGVVYRGKWEWARSSSEENSNSTWYRCFSTTYSK